MFINEQLTKELIESLNTLSNQKYSKHIKVDVEEIVMNALQPYQDQYNISDTDIKVSYYYQDNRLNVVVVLNDQTLTVDVFLKEN